MGRSRENVRDLLQTPAASPIVMEVLTVWSDNSGRRRQLDAPVDGSFTIGCVAIEVGGDIDIATAPRFAKLLDDVAGVGPTEIALDLADLAFMDASGLTAMASAAQRLPATSSLTLRSPSALVERLLTITGLQGFINVDRSPREATLAAEQQAGDHSTTVSSSPSRLISDLRRAVAMPANDAAIDAALRTVVEFAAFMLERADGVSVTLRRRGTLTTVAASNPAVAQMDADQYETGEGPCLAAASEGHWFHIDELASEQRWPEFVRRAKAEGINSILSTPLIVESQPVGALNIYSTTEHSFGPSEQQRAAWFAERSSAIVAVTRTVDADATVHEQLQGALASREAISRAEGFLMGQRSISQAAASAELRRSARRAASPVHAYALSVTGSGPQRAPQLRPDSA
ncbi:MAG: anti-sigma factor antagonist [Acidimicrobiia bacterium]